MMGVRGGPCYSVARPTTIGTHPESRARDHADPDNVRVMKMWADRAVATAPLDDGR